MKYGYIKSKLDGSELSFNKTSNNLPEEYSFLHDLPRVLNQGNDPICVPCSISSYINWKGYNNVNLKEIFNNGGTSSGMSFKDALHFLRHNGVSTDNGNFKINQYCMIGSIPVLKTALVMNGPCIIGVPVYNDSRNNFWKKYPSDSLQGGHALSVVGYNKDGFIIRNSWGTSYGDKGYWHMSYEDFNNIYEIWTII